MREDDPTYECDNDNHPIGCPCPTPVVSEKKQPSRSNSPLTGVLTTHRALSAEEAAALRNRFEHLHGGHVAVLTGDTNYIPATIQLVQQQSPSSLPAPLLRLVTSTFGLAVVAVILSLSALLMALGALLGHV